MSVLGRIKSLFGRQQPAVQSAIQEVTEVFYAKLPINLLLSEEPPFNELNKVCGKVPANLRGIWKGSISQYQLFVFHAVNLSTWGNVFAERILALQKEQLNELQLGWGDNHEAGIRNIYDIVAKASDTPMYVKDNHGNNVEVPVENHIAMTFLITDESSPYNSSQESGHPEFLNDEDWKLAIDLEHAKNESLAFFQHLVKFIRFTPSSSISPESSSSKNEDHFIYSPESLQRYLIPAEQGDAMAQLSLGVMFNEGIGVERDNVQAVKWLRKAADQGNMEAQFSLGLNYEFGLGVQQDYAEASKWFEMAAVQGHQESQLNLGIAYRSGKGATKDPIEAVKWIRKAAEQGLSEAQHCLGNCYQKGEGVDKDYTEAMIWHSKAAHQGHPEAQVDLGSAYFQGQGTAKDTEEAVKWFRNAGEQGNSKGQFILGSLYLLSEKIPNHIFEAYVWLSLAAIYGESKAIEMRDDAAKELSPVEIQAADEKVRLLNEQIKSKISTT